jgi:hypothetical protein
MATMLFSIGQDRAVDVALGRAAPSAAVAERQLGGLANAAVLNQGRSVRLARGNSGRRPGSAAGDRRERVRRVRRGNHRERCADINVSSALNRQAGDPDSP